MFEPKNEVSDVAINILKKRYFTDGETTWSDVVNRVMNFLFEQTEEGFEITKEMFLNRYFIPNSPCLVNAGKRNGGLSACFVVDFPDTIEGIYQTKLDFALIAKKGGGCGTTLSKLRPENASVEGSTHGYAGGPVKFFDTICHDMKAMTQAGFREMAMMGTMTIYHPDIIKFITAKIEEDGKMTTTNISVVVDNAFMESVKNSPNKYHKVFFDGWGEGYILREPSSGKYYVSHITEEEIFELIKQFPENYVLSVRDVFDMIVEGAWKNGEPGLIFYDKVNDSPYKYSNQEILATNPCGI
jgi:ribonucleoside-diphosphate reductase alpha chain